MDHIQTLALERLQQHVEEIRNAAVATDTRTRDARAAVRDVTAGYRVLYEHLHEVRLRELAREVMGAPLARACVALGEPTP